MPKGTYGNGKPKASKGRAKTRARRKLLFQAMTDLASLSPQRVKPIKGRPAKSKGMALKSSVKKMIWRTAGSKRKTGERGVR